MRPRPFWFLALGYIALRLLLTVALAAAVLGIAALAGLQMPLLVAAMLAVVVQLPLSWLLLAGLRRRVTAAAAESAGRRRRLREELREALDQDHVQQLDRDDEPADQRPGPSDTGRG